MSDKELTPEQALENRLHAVWAAGHAAGRVDGATETANRQAEQFGMVSRPFEPTANPYKHHE